MCSDYSAHIYYTSLPSINKCIHRQREDYIDTDLLFTEYLLYARHKALEDEGIKKLDPEQKRFFCFERRVSQSGKPRCIQFQHEVFMFRLAGHTKCQRA